MLAQMAKCVASKEGEQKCLPSPVYKGSRLLPRPASSAPPAVALGQLASSSSSAATGRSATEVRALKIHSDAERRRRERINAHLSTLRRMIPEAKQMDKATLLATVIEQMKELKRNATEMSRRMNIPPEINEVSIECCDEGDHAVSNEEGLYIKVSITCDDRPDLFAGLIQAFRGLRLRTVRADITSLGGRAQNVFILSVDDNSGSVCLRSLKHSIKAALARIASPDMACSSIFPSKRQRLLESHYSIMTI